MVVSNGQISIMESKPATARMHSYDVEIKGIASLEVLINKLAGLLWVGKLQAGEPDSRLVSRGADFSWLPTSLCFLVPLASIVGRVAQ